MLDADKKYREGLSRLSEASRLPITLSTLKAASPAGLEAFERH